MVKTGYRNRGYKPTEFSQQEPSSVATAMEVHTCGQSADCAVPHVALDSALFRPPLGACEGNSEALSRLSGQRTVKKDGNDSMLIYER